MTGLTLAAPEERVWRPTPEAARIPARWESQADGLGSPEIVGGS
jgi:hypothetical protein